MRASLALLGALYSVACSSPVADPGGGPAPNVTPSVGPGCYALQLGASPSPDVSLPSLIELSSEPAPGFVEPGRFVVHEPRAAVRRAPISWWRPLETGELELVLGGGYTGYSFILHAVDRGGWAGEGAYFADFGLEPTPRPLPGRLVPTSCP